MAGRGATSAQGFGTISSRGRRGGQDLFDHFIMELLMRGRGLNGCASAHHLNVNDCTKYSRSSVLVILPSFRALRFLHGPWISQMKLDLKHKDKVVLI